MLQYGLAVEPEQFRDDRTEEVLYLPIKRNTDAKGTLPAEVWVLMSVQRAVIISLPLG